jgi:hypothetical protein
MTVDVLGSHVSDTECVLACNPLPDNEIAIAFVALLFTVTEPTAFPAVVGLKFTFSAAACPGERVTFVSEPFVVNPLPVIVTLEIVTSEFPAFVSAALKVLLFPTITLPKLKLVGLTFSSRVSVVAVPLIAIVSGEFGALLVSTTEPVAFPLAAGVNTTLKVALCPGAIVSGTAKPAELNPAPETVACEIVALAVPLFESVIVCEVVAPVTAFGKLTLIGVAESAGAAGGAEGPLDPGLFDVLLEEAPTTPAHPPVNATATSPSITPNK